MDSEAEKAKQARKQKIKELEASLFGTDQYWSEKTDLPELKRVDEFKEQFNGASSYKKMEPKKSAAARTRKSFFLQTSEKKREKPTTSFSDVIINDEAQQREQEEDTTLIETSPAMKEKPLTLAKKLLRQEVDSLDHGFMASASVAKRIGEKFNHILSASTPNYQQFDEPNYDELSMQSFRSKMSSAKTLDAIPDRSISSAARRKDLAEKQSRRKSVPEPVMESLLEERLSRNVITAKNDAKGKSSDIFFDDLHGTFDNMPTNTFNDLHSAKTFEDIPSNVFDEIPKLEDPESEAKRHLIEKMLSGTKESKPLDLQMNEAAGATSKENGKVQYEQEFIALFIAQKDAGTRNASGNHRNQEVSIEIGHFCAPFWPGFCEANFCILHSTQQHNGQ